MSMRVSGTLADYDKVKAGSDPSSPEHHARRFSDRVHGAFAPRDSDGHGFLCPAVAKWTPQYFAENCGELRVKVYNASFAAPGKSYMSSVNEMAFKEYLSLMLTRTMDLRMFAFNIFWHAPELKEDIRFPPLANGFSKKLLFMFFGCKNSATPMHYDPDLAHLFHTVIHARKRVVLFHNGESRNLYRNPFTTRSYIDVDNPDFHKFPAEGCEWLPGNLATRRDRFHPERVLALHGLPRRWLLNLYQAAPPELSQKAAGISQSFR
jgi:hypothetical protein